MVTFYNFLAGLGGGIIAIIVSAIGIPFIRKIIFKLFESKIDERANKAISDHNAKNDTKMHITKMLYDKEQIALQNILENFSNIISTFALIHATTYNDINNKQFSTKIYDNALSELSFYTMGSIHKTIKDFVYIINEDIEEKFDKIYDKCYTVHTEIEHLIKDKNTLELKNYLYKMLDEIENDFKDIKKSIRKYYNNIKII